MGKTRLRQAKGTTAIVDVPDDPMSDPVQPEDQDLSSDEEMLDGSDLASDSATSDIDVEIQEDFEDEEEDEEELEDVDGQEDGGARLSPSAIPFLGHSTTSDNISTVASTTDAAKDVSIDVTKPTPYTLDAGHLLISDPNPLPRTTSSTLEPTLTSIARDAAQTLLNHLLTTCPITNSTSTASSSGIQMSLPPPQFALPREKRIPQPKPPTKWEKFAAKKGISKDKDGRKGTGKMVYDEEKGDWVPKWGYKGRNKDGEGDWLVEVDEKKEREKAGGGALDPRKEKRDERKEKIKRNERRMRANEKRATKNGGIR